jgi:hypothetical protein
MEIEDDWFLGCCAVKPGDGGSKNLHIACQFLQTTPRNIPKGSHLHDSRHENLKSRNEYIQR